GPRPTQIDTLSLHDALPISLPFQATERAQAVAREQEALQQRVQELSRAVEEVTRAAQAAGLGDTAFQARLREVQELLRRAERRVDRKSTRLNSSHDQISYAV